jgi:hypothetical protein
LKEVIGETGNSVTEFIVYVLRDIASGKSSKKVKEGLSKEEIGVGGWRGILRTDAFL